MDFFDRAMAQVKRHEGGYVNNPNDSGGETFRGITSASFPEWPGWPFIEAAKIEWANLPAKGRPKIAAFINAKFKGNATMDRLETALYRDEFWTPFEGILGGRVLWKVFDTAINNGKGPARKLLQKALNMPPLNSKLAVDGVIGPKTKLAASAAPEDVLLSNYCRAQADRYRELVRINPKNQEFLNGWLNRAAWVPPKD
jgi:lysozyme family protein